MGPVVSVALFITLWWLSFMLVLPMGNVSLAEHGEDIDPGVERAAPKTPRLLKKAGLAAAIAAVLWLLVALGVAVDLFGFSRI